MVRKQRQPCLNIRVRLLSDILQMDKLNAPIGIFDSGVGGISILREIHALMPHENIIYIADSANAPYGDKSSDFIKSRSLELASFLLTQNSKAIVVACNTATTEAITALRQQLASPIIGVEPAIKPAAEQSKNKTIGVLATRRTLRSKRFTQLIQEHAQEATVISQPCPGLMEVVESCEHHDTEDIQLLREYTQPLLDQGIDTLVLGCTHYPFLLSQLREITGTDIQILETGKPVALQLQRILKQQVIHSRKKTIGKITFYSSQNDTHSKQTIQKLWHKQANIQALPSTSTSP